MKVGQKVSFVGAVDRGHVPFVPKGTTGVVSALDVEGVHVTPDDETLRASFKDDGGSIVIYTEEIPTTLQAVG